MTIVVVGAGLVGAYSALYARELNPDRDIIVLDQDDHPGGLLRSDLHYNGMSFDRGTHILSTTGVEEIDSLLFSDLPPVAWHELDGVERDLCGLLFDLTFQESSPYLAADKNLLETLPTSDFSEFGDQKQSSHTLEEALRARYGAQICRATFEKPISNLFGAKLAELDSFVARLLPLNRIIADDFDGWTNRSSDEGYRQRIGCPDQFRLPQEYQSSLTAMYPRSMGVQRIFDHLDARIRERNIRFLLRTKLTELNTTGDVIESVGLDNLDSGPLSISGEIEVVWAAPPFPLANLLKLAPMKQPPRTGGRTVLVDFLANLSAPLKCYYYYDYGDNIGFRLTNYGAFCDEAKAAPAQPFTYEIWNSDLAFSENDARDFVATRFLELGLIASPDGLSDVRLRTVAQGFGFATVESMKQLDQLARSISQKPFRNFLNVGMLSSPGLFFMSELLRNAQKLLSLRFSRA